MRGTFLSTSREWFVYLEGKISVFFSLMELRFSFFTIIVLTFLFLLLVVKTVRQPGAKKPISKTPPGPWQLPLMGNLHQLISPQPHHTLRDLASRYGPLMQLQLGEVPTVVVSSPEVAKEVLKNHDINFSNRPYLLASSIMSYNSTNILFSPYGDYWRQLRKICTMELLSAKRVQSLRVIREEEVAALIKSICSHGESLINLSEKIFSSTYDITARAAFGGKCKDQEAFISIITATIKLAGGFCLADMYPSSKVLQLLSGLRIKLEKLHKKNDRILQDIVNEHKERRKGTETGKLQAEDLVDVLLKLQQHGDLDFALTDNNIKAVILDIFAAGSETSATVVEWAISELLKIPRLMKRAQDEVRQVFNVKGNVDETGLPELKFLESVVEETLRLHPSAPLLVPRESAETCLINGYEIPAKTKVIVNAWAIARDPKYWSEPETFNPERFLDSSIDYKGTDFEYIPFGAGRRICPGILYAMPNIMLPLAQLLFHFDWKLPGGMKPENLDMSEAFGITVRRTHDLLLIPIPHFSSSVA